MKKPIVVFIIALTVHVSAYAQQPKFPYEASIGAGITTLYGDLDKHPIGGGGYLRIAYHPVTWLSIGIEGQHGALRSSDRIDEESKATSVREGLSAYYTGIVAVRFRPIPFLNPDYHGFHKNQAIPSILESFYIGAGGGMTFNHQIRTWQTDINNGLAFVIPVQAGLDIPLTPYYYLHKQLFFINLNGQAVFSTNSEMDGYDPQNSDNKKKDMYMFYSVGLVMRL